MKHKKMTIHGITSTNQPNMYAVRILALYLREIEIRV
jgi:hypothetical protein